MDKELKKDFQKRPAWIFITVILLLIQASLSFTSLVLDFFPSWMSYKKWINLFFIIVGFFLFGLIYWWDEIRRRKSHDPNKMSEDERKKKNAKEWSTWRQNIFKYYPLNVITLKIIPLFICWVISHFINKRYKPYLFWPFYFPKHWDPSYFPKNWKQCDYEKIISEFFKSMFRVYIENLDQSYEIKFGRDFQHIELKWTNKNDNIFNEPKNNLYEKIFSEDRFKHIRIFTWIFPFGLYWNLIRVIKNLFLGKKKLKNQKDQKL